MLIMRISTAPGVDMMYNSQVISKIFILIRNLEDYKYPGFDWYYNQIRTNCSNVDRDEYLTIGSKLKRIWHGWIMVANLVGNAQMILILTVIYWLLLPLTAIPMKVVSDPLRFKYKNRAVWLRRAKYLNLKDQGHEGEL